MTSPRTRPRGHSLTNTPSSNSPLSRVTTSSSSEHGFQPPSPTQAQSFSSLLSPPHQYPDPEMNASTSTFRLRSRSRSKSPGRLDSLPGAGTATPPGGVPLSWWVKSSPELGNKKEKQWEVERRPWVEKDVKGDDEKVPPEQTEGWNVTRQRVYMAARSVLGTALDVTHEALALSADMLELAPIPGLSACARTLLLIWDSLQMVDLNRLQCLRLTERCANILLSVREEVKEAGDQVTEELRVPISKLTEAFNTVYIFLQKQAHRPFLKRYLKRDEILRQIEGCDAELQEALGMFSLSIQIRILKQIQASEARRQRDTKMLLDEVIAERERLSSMSTLGQIASSSTLGQLQLTPQITRSSTSSGWTGVVGIVDGVPVGAIGGVGLGLMGTSGTGNALQLTGVETHQGQGQLLSAPSLTSFDSSGSTSTVSSNTTVTAPAPVPAPVPVPAQAPRTTLPTTVSEVFPTYPGSPVISPPIPSTSQLPPLPSSPTSYIDPHTNDKSTLKSINAFLTAQNVSDAALDAQDLRNLMREALAKGSDVEMLSVLGVGREEMPEAIKTMQRALEGLIERERDEEEGLKDFQREMVAGYRGVGGGDESMLSPIPERPPMPKRSSSQVSAKLAKMARRLSTQATPAIEEEPGSSNARSAVRRSKTVSSSTGSTSSSSAKASGGSGSGQARSVGRKDTLDREFIESGIDALRRMSRTHGVTEGGSLPSWTITRYEVDREKKIGIGFFSDVYRGKWRNQTVAIKVLAETTPRNLFLREIKVWKGLRHPNVLELLGASSASGEAPWFFVSPYMRNGSLSDFLRRIVNRDEGPPAGLGYPGSSSLGITMSKSSSGMHSRGRSGSFSGAALGEVEREWDLLRFMHEIAKGMEYLHGNGVLHGDLKAANVLVDDRIHCVISDFGQSEMKSEAYRISGTPVPHGTLRWQAPELMDGRSQSQLTVEMDVYAFAITCIEVLSMGRMPWPLVDDDAVRHFVLKDDTRPTIPQTRFSTPAVQNIIRNCWKTNPFERPHFSVVARDLKALRKGIGAEDDTMSPTPVQNPTELEYGTSRPSPDMRPIGLPPTGSTPPRDLSTSPTFPTLHSHREEIVTTPRIHMPEPVIYTPSAPSSATSSLFDPSTGSQSEDVEDGYDSPPPANERLAETRNERRYRMLLVHEFHPSLTLPLWSPSPIAIGAVGYLSKPKGAFVTLFNAFQPEKSSEPRIKSLPNVNGYVAGYGKVATGSQRQDKRNAVLRSMDTIAGFLTFSGRGRAGEGISQSVTRRYSFPLRAGHKAAYLCTETTIYRYVESLDAPKKWFKANADLVLDVYGEKHHIQREDLYFVIGTLDAPDHALFVSHNHPDGQAHFNVYTSNKSKQPWGTFTTDTEVPLEMGGPVYHEEVKSQSLSASKVSNNGDPWNTVLVARLRFKPDVLEPTSL
ncbi:hypothetical protein Moror_9860 [Moniliophthora roreri MCA 2997]|uniref:Protein kinase domain-containing protein n=1 Tax=Moniliophthora roreri (strain MCA 2997) TaxID=1381753 RepID=V2Y4D6_MONRO|nr:hypothetical protein Moror_9860 [Moniliophthora roreri MCA 2997]